VGWGCGLSRLWSGVGRACLEKTGTMGALARCFREEMQHVSLHSMHCFFEDLISSSFPSCVFVVLGLVELLVRMGVWVLRDACGILLVSTFIVRFVGPGCPWTPSSCVFRPIGQGIDHWDNKQFVLSIEMATS